MPKRTKEEAQETRENILDAALDVFAERGYSGTTFVDIAERIDMTKGAIYWHFRDKPALLAALIKKALEHEEQLVAEEVPELLTLDDLKRHFVARGRLVTEDETCRKFVFFISVQMEWSAERLAAIHDEMRLARSLPLADIEQVLAKAKQEGEVRGDVDIKVARDLLFGLWFGLVSSHLQGLSTSDPITCVETGIEMVLDGIRA